MDLPTYTNIWRIEKRLYKLYDLRLPMPLPIVWIGVFVGVVVPWSLLLYLLGLPFDAPWHVVYLVPPGVVTWLSTRPVIESKRLTELLQSQVRYVGEPRSWCRMAPASEPSEVSLSGRVWRAAPQQAAPVRVKAARKARHAQARRPAAASPREVRPAVAAAAAAAATAPVTRDRVAWGTAPAPRRGVAPALGQVVPGEAPAIAPALGQAVSAEASAAAPADLAPAAPAIAPAEPAAPAVVSAGPPAPVAPAPASVTPVERVSPVPPHRAPAAQVKTPADPDRAVRATDRAAEDSAPEQVSDVPAASAAPIGTEALRRLRRLAASAEADRAQPSEEPTAAPEPAERQSEIPLSAGQLPEPEPAGQRPEAPLPAGQSAVAPGPMDVPGSVDAPETVDQPPASPRFVGPAPFGRRAAEPVVKVKEAEKAPTEPDESPRTRHRKGHPAPVGQFPEAQRVWPPERSTGTPAGVSIRAVVSDSTAKADPVMPAVPVSVPGSAQSGARVRRVESVVGRDSSGGWRRLAQVVIGPGGTSRTDGSEVDEARTRTVFSGSRRVVVLGCTGGAGQTTTALMLGHTLARYREDRVLAVDANIGIHSLSSRIQGESPETLSSLLAGLDNVRGYLGMRAYTSRCASGLEVLAGDTDSGAEQRLSDRTLFSDRRLSQAVDVLDQHYKLIVVDPAAALAARVLSYADQLVLVVPASEDGPDAVAMTYEWLDGHGCADLRRRAIMVVNGVSRRSMSDVEQAEAVARGRCRAIVRVPWEDELAPGRSERVEPSHLRAPGRRAYLALAGVVAAGFGAAQAVRPSEEELAQ
ncbi:TcpE family conjugal transfer membrane protein [Streptosporangium sp. NPDC000396]|uniref:TcpE family conjugal transfer membrane protein n=1 Tax=Streptosporangium sp. NPDC000396 TaxID=3366185 RepID=UPI00368122D0